MSKELQNNNDLKGMANEFWGSTNLDRSDFAIPRVSLGQPTSKVGEPGHFNFNNGESRKEMLKCKLVVPQKTRVLYGSGASRCKSDNFVEPSPFVSNPVSSSCMTCPASQWGDDDPVKQMLGDELGIDAGQLYKPLCNETYNLLMADEKWQPFFIGFQKTQLKVVQEKLFSRLQSLGIPPYMVEFDMTLEKITGDRTVYYSVKFDNFKQCNEEDAEIGRGLYGQYSKRAQEILSKQHEEMDENHRKESVPMPDDEYPHVPEMDEVEEMPF